MDIRKIIYIDQLIKVRRTGKPSALAAKLGMSERSVYHYINYLKVELKAPIKWNADLESYAYETVGSLNFNWQD